MTTKEKILLFLKETKIKKSDFFTHIDVAPSNFKGVAMKSELGGDKIIKILTLYPKLSPDWLLLDRGSMFRDEKLKNTVNEQLPSSNESILYKMYKEEREEAGKLKEEIGALKERIRQMEDGNTCGEKFTEMPTLNYQQKSDNLVTIAKTTAGYVEK